jgi:hypothetical protein
LEKQGNAQENSQAGYLPMENCNSSVAHNKHQEGGEKEPTLIIEQHESGEEEEQISTSLFTMLN